MFLVEGAQNIFSLNLSYSSFVSLKSDLSNSYSNFLVDTGATISIFKINKLLSSRRINLNSKCKISGIKEGTIDTIGEVTASVVVQYNLIEQVFHIVDDKFPIPVDGIIGLDFIRNNHCILNYDTWNIEFPIARHNKICLPMYDSPNNDRKLFVVPARCEIIRRVDIVSSEKCVLIPSQKLADNVYVGHTIVHKDNPFVRIMNTDFEDVTIMNTKLESQKLSDYTILDPSKYKASNRNIVFEKLKKNFPDYAPKELTKLCTEFLDIFALETDQISYNNVYKQKLRMKTDEPIYTRNYRIPHAHKEIVDNKIKNMLSNGTIESSTSEYNSPILLVPKKSLPGNPEKRWRFCVDYRQINKNLISDKFPLPRIDSILDQLGRARFFCLIDLINGFYQIELNDESKDITSFTTDTGIYRFKSIPFGIKIGPNAFQRMMSIAFSGLSMSKCFIYMDDLIVVAASERLMMKNLREVFETCRKCNLKLNPDKCEFFKREVTYLGHKCSDKGIEPDESKFTIIKNYPRPSNADSARRFVAFCNYYRRFIKNFSYYSYHITRLTKKKVPFHWSDDCETAFQYLKNALMNPPILKYPDFDKPFCITTDASITGCGAVLSQEYDGIDLPVSYASRSFTKGEQNKSTPLQELTAIHWAIKYYRPYVFGKKFLVKSDHRPLVYLFTMKDPSSKLVRMRLELEEYDFVIEYIKGKNNVTADALSRIDFQDIRKMSEEIQRVFKMTTRSDSRKIENTTISKTNESKQDLETKKFKVSEFMNHTVCSKMPRLYFNLKATNPYLVVRRNKMSKRFRLNELIKDNILNLRDVLLNLDEITSNMNIFEIQLSLNDQIFESVSAQQMKFIGNKLLKNLHIILTPRIKIISDKDEIQKILTKYHNDPIFGGHCGMRRFYSKLKMYYHWRKMLTDVSRFVKNCDKCATNKASSMHKEPLTLTPTPQSAFDIVSIDTMGPLPTSLNGNKYIVTIMCDLTKYFVTMPVPNKEAVTIAQGIFENFILTYGPMKRLLTDRGSEYINSILNELCSLLNIEQKSSTPYHHRTLGTVERSHRTFNEYVRSYINDDKNDWEKWLIYFTYCFNTTPSTAIDNFCPFQLVFGKLPPSYDFLNYDKIDPVYNIDQYYQEVRYRLQIANRLAQRFIEKEKLKRKFDYDSHINPQTLTIGDLVMIPIHERHKFDPLFKGPFKIIHVSEPNVTIENSERKEKVLHKDKVKRIDSCFYYRFC